MKMPGLPEMEEVSSLTSRLDFRTLNISDTLPLYALSRIRTVIFTLFNKCDHSICLLSIILTAV